MKGRKPGTSRIRRAFLVAAAALGITAGGTGIEQLPKDPMTDTHITFQTGTPDAYGYNISPLDQMWKQTLGMKSQSARDADLLEAARAGDSWRVGALVRHDGFNPYGAGGDALTAAARAGHADVVNVLLKANVQAYHQQSAALVAAAENNHLQIVQQLLAAGADAGAQDGRALKAAIDGGNTAMADALLSATRTVAVTIPASDSYWSGRRAFDDHISPRTFGPPPFFSPFDYDYTLVQRPAIDVNAHQGQALYDAVYNNDAAMVRVLLKHGADADARGGAIKDLARDSGNAEMMRLLSGKAGNGPSLPPPAI